MKKFAILAMTLCLFSQAKAEDNLQFAPLAAQPGASGNTVRFDVEMFKDSNFEVSQLQFDVDVPAGMTLTTAGTTKGILPSYTDYDDDDNPITKYYHSLTCVNVGGNTWRVTVTTTSAGKVFASGNGIVARVRYTLDAGMAEGVYPVKIYAVKYSGTDGVSHKLPETSSYIKVGAPAGAELKLTGELPSKVNAALVNESAVTSLDLSDVTAVNGTFTYVDGREVVAPATSIESDLQFVRNTTDYYSINLPFASTSVEGNVYGCDWDASFADDNNYFFNDATSTDKDETYLAKGEVTIKGHGAIEGVSKKTNQVGIYVYDNTMYYGNALTVKPTRGLFWDMAMPDPSNRRIVINGTLTNINAAAIDAQSDNTYDLQGRQVQNAKNGVFVVNGKKQFVK